MRKFFLSLIVIILSYLSNARTTTISTRPISDEKTNISDSLIDIFRTMDTSILYSGNEETISNYLIQKNQEIISYISTNYENPEFIVASLDPNDVSTTYFGLVCAFYEANNFQPIENNVAAPEDLPQWFTCALNVVGVTSGLSEVFATLGTFSWGSALTVVKFIVKKYVFGWFTAMTAIAGIIRECF